MLKKGTLSILQSPLESNNSTCAALCSHLSNSLALVYASPIQDASSSILHPCDTAIDRLGWYLVSFEHAL